MAKLDSQVEMIATLGKAGPMPWSSRIDLKPLLVSFKVTCSPPRPPPSSVSSPPVSAPLPLSGPSLSAGHLPAEAGGGKAQA